MWRDLRGKEIKQPHIRRNQLNFTHTQNKNKKENFIAKLKRQVNTAQREIKRNQPRQTYLLQYF